MNIPVLRSATNYDKKIIKKINDINQELKNIFSTYYISPSGVVYSKPENFIVQKGIHFGQTPFRHFIDQLDTIYLHSDSIFNYIKDYKKSLVGIEMTNNDIFLVGDEKYYIGVAYPEDNTGFSNIIDTLPTSYKNDIQLFLNNNNNFNPNKTLTDEVVESLSKNEYYDISIDNFYTRITKEIIPGIKKKHKISISFCNTPTDPNLFNMIIQNIHSSELTTYHKYTCVRT